MTTHPFRWEGLAFGLFFLAVVGNWAVWEQDLLTTRQLTLTASGLLIALGLLGVAATVWQTRQVARPHPAPTTHPSDGTRADTDTTLEGPADEEAHPQP